MKILALRIAAFVAAGAISLTLANNASANPADIDTSWGDNGRVLVSADGTSTHRAEMGRLLLQPNGRLVTVGTIWTDGSLPPTQGVTALVGFDATGALDASFGNGGRIVLPKAATSNGECEANASRGSALQADGKIVFVIECRIDSNLLDPYLIVTRLHVDGTLDSSFGTAGRAYHRLRQDSEHQTYRVRPSDVAIAPDGKIVVPFAYTNRLNDVNWYGVARFNTDGSIDATFGNYGGTAEWTKGNRDARVAVGADGKVVLTGRYIAGTGIAVVARLNADGTFDSSFGTGGQASIEPRSIVERGMVMYDPYFRDIELQSDGKLVIVGDTNYVQPRVRDVMVARLDTNGQLDTTFDGNGIVTTDAGGPDDTAGVLALQQDGAILIAGLANISPADGGSFTIDVPVVRYRTDGSLDPTWHDDGIALFDHVPGSTYEWAHEMAIAPNGRIFVKATPNVPYGSPLNTFIFALRGDQVCGAGKSCVSSGDDLPKGTAVAESAGETGTGCHLANPIRSANDVAGSGLLVVIAAIAHRRIRRRRQGSAEL